MICVFRTPFCVLMVKVRLVKPYMNSFVLFLVIMIVTNNLQVGICSNDCTRRQQLKELVNNYKIKLKCGSKMNMI